MRILETQRRSTLQMFEECYPTERSKRNIIDAFESWYEEKTSLLAPDESRHPLIQGGSTPLTSMRVRNDRLLTLLTTTGQSHEIDFNIAFGQAIEIWAFRARVNVADVTASRGDIVGLIDLDGPALANNSIVTQALFDARQLLDSSIYNVGFSNDALTSGGAPAMVMDTFNLPEPMLTARNLGDAGITLVTSGGILFSIYHKLVEVTRDEQLLLFALGRA